MLQALSPSWGIIPTHPHPLYMYHSSGPENASLIIGQPVERGREENGCPHGLKGGGGGNLQIERLPFGMRPLRGEYSGSVDSPWPCLGDGISPLPTCGFRVDRKPNLTYVRRWSRWSGISEGCCSFEHCYSVHLNASCKGWLHVYNKRPPSTRKCISGSNAILWRQSQL